MEVWQDDDFQTGVARIYNIQPQYGHDLFCIVVNVVLDSQNENGWKVTIGALDVEQHIVYVKRDDSNTYELFSRKEFNPTFFVQRSLDKSVQRRVIYRREFDQYLPTKDQVVTALSERMQNYNFELTTETLPDYIERFQRNIKTYFWMYTIPSICWTLMMFTLIYYSSIPSSSLATVFVSKLFTSIIFSAPIWLISWYFGFTQFYYIKFDCIRLRKLSEMEKEDLLSDLKSATLLKGLFSIRSFMYDYPQEAQTLVN